MSISAQSVAPRGNAGEGYWSGARHPLTALVFVAPMLLIYEAGVLAHPEAVRNGADLWLRRLLDAIGLTHYFLLPVLIACLLLAWHHVSRRPWRIRGRVLAGMAGESAALGLLLLLLAGGLYQYYPAAAGAPTSGIGERLIAYLGAGIYEELLFRLMLLPAAAAALKWAGVPPRGAGALSLLLTSFVFAAAHYRLFATVGDDFEWFSFMFRFAAGAFFSLLFIHRGFGVAAGAHAVYDVLTAVV